MDKYLKDIQNILGKDWKSDNHFYWEFYYENKKTGAGAIGINEKEENFFYSCTEFHIDIRTKKIEFKTFLNTIKILRGEINGNKTNTNL